ncbi:Serine-aspartate repeat-containing protein D precursor [uncultured Ruminococcus sp.]|nr:Serine-aspartate repeat-containing protein D precursor [uncultured Clostridium sp.]SCI48548.1 Serine-aspartate repeat-containing protein D precursor [uncultured Ruminococcus sp.]
MTSSKRSGFQRAVSMLMMVLFVLNMVIGSMVPSVSAAEPREVPIPSASITFESDQMSGSGASKVSDNLYLLSSDRQFMISMRYNVNQSSGGYVTGAYLKIVLPYLYIDPETGKMTISDTKPDNIPEDKLMGIEAKVAESDTWLVDNSEGEAANEGYRRGTILLKSYDGFQVPANQPLSFDLTCRFFGDLPENESANIKIGGGYAYYHDGKGGTSESGYDIQPGSVADDPSAIRIINLVNSNLVWTPSIDLVKTSVLWDKYNYMVYKVRIDNQSEDVTSKIDHFNLIMYVQNTTGSMGKGGVLEKDMMQWEYVEGQDPIKNEAVSEEDYRKTFIGKPNEGGALIYDVTDIPEAERQKLDLDTFSNLGDPLPYNYTLPGTIGIPLDEEHSELYPEKSDAVAEGEKHSYREYYVAVPYPNNFGASLDCEATFRPTIYFGGRDLEWTKDTGKQTWQFVQKKYEFNHHKYILDGQTPADNKEIAIGDTDTYYLDGFDNTGNVPVFNAVTTDTLPEEFRLDQLEITLNSSGDGREPELGDWFKDNVLTFLFLDQDQKETEVSLQELGVSAQTSVDAQQNKTWTYSVRQAIQDYLDQHAGWTFAQKFKLYFKERIPAGDTFQGRIAVTGEVDRLLEYKNQIDTSFEHWYYTVGTAEIKEGYVVEKNKQVDPDSAALTTKRAEPVIETHGVLRENGNEDVGPADEKQDVPVNEDMSSLRYVLGNESISKMLPGVLEIGPLGTVDPKTKDFSGLEANTVRLSKQLLAHAAVQQIVLTDINGKEVVFEKDELKADSNGEIRLDASQWLGKEPDFDILKEAKIIFDSFDGNVKVSENAFVDILGTPNTIGEYEANAVWQTQYDIPNMAEDIVEKAAKLNVLKIEPVITGTANYDGKSAATLTVPNKANGWYEFTVENRSKSSAGIVDVDFDLTSVGNKANSGSPDQIQGFRTDRIEIGPSYVRSGVIDYIEFYDWNQAVDQDQAKLKIPFADLVKDYGTADGGISIPKDAFSALTQLKSIRIHYTKFNGLAVADSDPDQDASLQVKIYGNTDWYDKLDNVCSFIPRSKIYTDKDIVKSTAAFQVDRPAQLPHAHIVYDDVKESSLASTANTDKNQAALGIPYDRDFIFRTELVNQSISVLDDVDTTFTLKLDKTAGGFHTTAWKLYEDVLKNYRTFEKITLTDLDGNTQVLTYDAGREVFRAESGQEYPLADGGWTVNREQMEQDLGLNGLVSLVLTGKQYQITETDDSKEYYVDFYGYEDAEIGSKEVLKVDSVNFLDGLRNVDSFQSKAKDDVLAYVSKMYFDTVITAGYNDNEPTKKYSKTSTPLEHVRTEYRSSGGSKWGDNSELEVGYKALGSFAVDFRQYLNAGTVRPFEVTRQEHEGMDYVRTQSFNTAAELVTTIDLPEDYFDSHYLKIDPRAKDYVQKIKVYQKDGASYELDKSELVYGAVEEDSNGNKYCRVNLLKGNKDAAFSNNLEDYYLAPEQYGETLPQNPVTRIDITLKINQEQYTEKDGQRIANNPDFGTWYQDSNEASKYMFEVSGRFYCMDETPNKTGKNVATATTKMTIGGGRSIERVSDGAQTTKSPWSFKDYYRGYYYYGSYVEREYKAGHLFSKTMVHTVHDYDRVYKGATTIPTNDVNDKAEFGMDNQFVVSFFRNSRTARYQTSGYDYETTGNLDTWRDQDPDDWSGKIGYADEVILRDTMPMIRPDATYSYYGFLATGLELKPAISKYFDKMVLNLEDVDNSGNKTNQKQLVLTRNDLTDSGGVLTLKLEYSDTSAEESVSNGVLTLKPGQFLTSYDIHLTDMMGNGEYNKEVGSKGTPDGNGTNADTDLVIHGRPYTIKQKNPDKDGTNTIQPITKTDYEPGKNYVNIIQETSYSNATYTETARLMGFLIDFHAGYQIRQQGTRDITDYQTNNLDPNVAEFGVKLYNQNNTGNNDGVNKVARVQSANATNTMNPYYRLQHIYIPEAFVTGDWFRVSKLVLTANGKTKEIPVSSQDLSLSASKPGCYEIDVEQLLRENPDLVSSYANSKTDFVTYSKAFVDKFQIVFEAVRPDREDPNSVLENGQYLSADKADGYAYWYDGVYVDRTPEDFDKDEWTADSTPSFGKNPNRFAANDAYSSSTGWLIDGNYFYNRLSATFTSVDPNADIYDSNLITPNSDGEDHFVLSNLVATMVTRLSRNRDLGGGNTGFAYDNDKNPGSRLEVDKDHLVPYDYLEYTLSTSAKDDSSIPLERPTMHFAVPEGQRLVKWEIVSNTTGIDNADITAEMTDASGAKIAAQPQTDYSLGNDGSQNYYRELVITGGKDGAQIPAGTGITIRITTQLTEELTDTAQKPAFEGENLQANAWVTAASKHAYPQYCIETRNINSTTGKYQTLNDLGGEVTYTRNYAEAVNGKSNQVYESRMVSDVTFKDTTELVATYSFDDEEYAYDEQGAKLTISSIKNDTRHYLESMQVTISLLDPAGYRGFTLTQNPVIGYPALLADANTKPGIKLEYWCEGENDWITSTGNEDEAFLRTVQKIRWTYYEIDAFGTDGNELTFDNVELIGVGRYEDIRKPADTTAMAESYLASIDTEVVHNHPNVETKTVQDDATQVTLNETVSLTEDKVYTRQVYRENPEVNFYTQVFDTEAEAEAAININATQKVGYRPEEEMWQKIVLINNHKASNGKQTADQGVLIDPVFYDKLPEYLSSEDLENENFTVRWLDITGKEKNPDAKLQVAATHPVRGEDYGGAMVYPKSQTNTLVNKDAKLFDDLKPSAANSKQIDFTMYELRFEKQNGQAVRVEVGDTIEIWYKVKARKDDLPMVYVDQDRDLASTDDQHPGYFPRVGEYYTLAHSALHANGESFPFSTATNEEARAINNQNRLMDLDYLMHDIGLSGQKNEQVDRWEYLNGSQTQIPGSAKDISQNSYQWRDNYLGDNGVLFDEDINPANNHQAATYYGDTTNKNSDDMPSSQKMVNSNNRLRDWWRFVLSPRTQFDRDWDGKANDLDQRMPILWSQTRLHLQKAWLVTASEMAGKNRIYEKTEGDGYTNFPANPNYSANENHTGGESLANGYRKLTDDSSVVALQYNEDFTTRLYALNYGDWKLDGVEFTYTMPRGIRPKLDENGNFDPSSITAEVLSSVSTSGYTLNDGYTPIDPGDIEVEVLQTPSGEDKGYKAPNRPQDPQWNPDTDDTYYSRSDESQNTQPWVLKITVKHGLNKWFNRGTEKGYKIRVNIPSNVYLTNENQYWYDRVVTRPYMKPDSKNYYYYQILDYDHWEGTTKERMRHNQCYGMDYMWYHYYNVNDNKYIYHVGSPNTPYIDGYNIQDNEVQLSGGDVMGTRTQNKYDNYTTADKSDLYAQTGTRAVMRKPFVRLWSTAGDDLTGATRSDYYFDTEGDTSKINIHVENKYWLDQYAPNAESKYNYDYAKFVHNYEVDGGARGDLILPVITNILPYGIVPVATDGTLFSQDNAVNAGKEVSWTLYQRDLAAGQNVKTAASVPAEQEKYDARVTYELIDRVDSSGQPTGEKEGRYVVTFTPAAAADGGDIAKEARLASQKANIFSLDTFTYAAPKAATSKDGTAGEEDELYRNYQDNRTYLTSRMPGFKYIVDEDIKRSGESTSYVNPYTVGSLGQHLYPNTNGAQIPDDRLDAIKHTYTYTYNGGNSVAYHTMGNLPDDKLNHTYEQNTGLIGKLTKYEETQELNVEDYPQLNDKAVLSSTQKDFDQNGANTHSDDLSTQAFADLGVTNTLKIRTSSPRLSVEHYVAPDKNALGEKEGGDDTQAFDYSDDIWYSAKVVNEPSSAANYEQMGAVHHAKMVFSFHLPSVVNYSGSAGWNVENSADQYMYNNENDFCIEYYDAEKKKTVTLSQKEMREQGWGVQLISDSSEEWKDTDLNHKGQIVTFEVTTPKSEGFTDYASYVQGEKPAGYFPSGSWMNFKIRTRVDNASDTGVLDDPDVWSGYTSQVYTTIHDTDGYYALRDDGTFAPEAEADRIPADNYNGYKVETPDGHRFYEQAQALCLWGPAEQVSDEKDDQGDLTQDHDRDQEYDANYVTARTAQVNIQKPRSTVRVDTGKQRLQVNDPTADRYIMEDAHVRSAYNMWMWMDQAVNETAAVNTFIVNYNVPYYGTDEGTPDEAFHDNSKKALRQTLNKIRTGRWEIPDTIPESELDAETRRILEENLRVYLQVLPLEEPWDETGYYYPGANDSNGWITLGKQDGYRLDENATIDIGKDYPQYQRQIYQVRWVIKTQGFISEEGVTYSAEQAPIYYPVPAGFRLDVDASDQLDGKQEMDDVDPERYNKDELAQDVQDNSAYIELNTRRRDLDDDDGKNKHSNHFVTGFPQYDDRKHTLTSERARGGYYVDPEVPTVDLGIDVLYFTGGPIKGYKWDNNVIIDSSSSTMLKYKVSYSSISSKQDPDIVQDNVSNPNISVAVPYIDRLREDDFQYVDYQEPGADGFYQGDYYIGDAYGQMEDETDEAHKVTENLDNKTPLWTWYVQNEDGTILTPEELKNIPDGLQLTQESPTFTTKVIDKTTNQRKILNYYFTGTLEAGQTLKIEFMLPVKETDGNAVPTDLLQSKAYGFKKGAFEPYTKSQGSSLDSLVLVYDNYDVNNNTETVEMGVSRSSNAIAFKTVSSVSQNKTVTTDLVSNQTEIATPVPEGGTYEYKVSMINKSESQNYTEGVFYDVLPYLDDYEIKNLDTSTNQKIPRNSKWHGWIDPSTIRVLDFAASAGGVETGSVELVPNKDYEVWVGPIVKQGSDFVLNDISSLPDQEAMSKKETYDELRASDQAKAKYFVKLDELMALDDGEEKETLIKGIRAVWVQMADDYTILANNRLRLFFDMHAPLNLPEYVGTLQMSEDAVNATVQYNEAVKDFSAWNTFVAHWNSGRIELVRAGVYTNAPAGRGYIGSYVWNDADYSTVPDDGEGDYGVEEKTGRIQLKNKTTDLDFDGKEDDPGINGVKVELLTVKGYPANRDGQAVAAEIIDGQETGQYLVLDEETGLPITDPLTGKQEYSLAGGPVAFETESDYYDNDGYYILANLKPGQYNLRYTFPENYNQYSVTTTSLGKEQIPVQVYRNNELVYSGTKKSVSPVYDLPADRLVVQTAEPITVKAVEEDLTKYPDYDKEVTSYNLGVGRAYTYGGSVWLDEHEIPDPDAPDETKIDSNGKREDGEPYLEDMEVSVYNIKDQTKPCLDGDGNPAVYTTKADGEYQFRLKPGESYIVRVTDKTTTEDRLLKPSPWTYESDPLTQDDDNDLSKINKNYETKAFEAAVPYDQNGDPIFADDKKQSFQANTNIDLGLINAGRGYLGKFVWNDADYDGIMDPDEEGVPGVTVTLESYYYKDGQWVRSQTDRTMTTNDGGVYVFDNVMSFHSEGGKRYLAGYKLKIDPALNEEIFKQYGVTHFYVNKGVSDSDLGIDRGYYLNDDYIIIAVDATDETVPDNQVTYQGHDYDLSDAEIILDYDAGLSEYQYGNVDGIIWEDADYDGVMDSGETGIDGVTVYLEQYYKDANGRYQKVTKAESANGTVYTGELSTLTANGGNYHFENVPTFVKIDGKNTLCYYRLRADAPAGFGVTRYQQQVASGGTNSDWITNQYAGSENYLTSPADGDYFMVARPAGKLVNPHYTLTDGKDSYDIIRKQADHTGYDGGLKAYPQGELTGFIWDDLDYDGIRDTGENGVPDVSVFLQRYYYDGTKWVLDTAFTEQKATTQADGSYTFAGLDTQVVVKQKAYLAGYTLKAEALPDGYGITYYQQGNDRTKDSDLNAADLTLTQAGEYIPVAAVASQNSTGGGYNSSTVSVKEVSGKTVVYDMLAQRTASGNDGGLVKYPDGTIIGRVWNDKDYDGIQDSGEVGIGNVSVELERYYYDDGQWQKDADFPMHSAITDGAGKYTFTGLDTQVVVNQKAYLAGYALKVDSDSLPSGCGITYYQQGSDPTKDSDLDASDLSLTQAGKYLPVAKPVKAANNSSVVKVGTAYYDMLLADTVSGQDAGLVEYPDGAITGIIWDDLNYNGIQDENEPGYAGVEVLLDRYYLDGETWIQDPSFAQQSRTTLEDGTFRFDNLDTQVEQNGTVYLAGYALNLKELPSDRAVTKYWRGDDRSKDSNLISSTKSLMRSGEYLPVAAVKDPNKAANSSQITMTDVEKQQVTYDLLTARTVSGYDGGFSEYKGGSLGGIIWRDQNFDGIRQDDEPGVENVRVILNRYILKNGVWEQDADFVPYDVPTNERGEYLFDALETYLIDGPNKYLYGYQVTVDLDTIPEGYEVTHYQMGEDKTVDSDLNYQDGALTKADEYVLLVDKAETESQNPDYIIDGYDVVQGIDIRGYDGGILNYQTGSISGVIWEDQSYDGIRQDDEPGVAEVPVSLQRYYYDGTQWLFDDTFQMEAKTGRDGAYLFDGLATVIQKEETDAAGNTVVHSYLAAYRPKVEALSERWAVSRPYMGDDPARDSDLDAKTLALLPEGEVMILAAPAQKGADGSYHYTSIKVTGKDGTDAHYAPMVPQDLSGQDAGLTAFEQGAVGGTVWLDADKDGIMDLTEPQVSGVEVILTQYAFVDGAWKQVEDFEQTIKTNRFGKYLFGDLPLFRAVEDDAGERQYQMLGYRLNIEELPDNREITKYMQNKGIDDSKLILDQLKLTDKAYEFKGCMILSEKAAEATNPVYRQQGYDLVKARDIDQMHAGLLEMLAELPKTGDNLWIILSLAAFCVASGAFLLIIVILKRKNRKK